MKKKIINAVIDFLLIFTVLVVTDIVMEKVFRSENFWLEIGVYIVLYGILYGSKHGLTVLWRRYVSKKKKTEEEK